MDAKKINIIFHSSKDLRLSSLEKNIGIGGTEYAVLLLAEALALIDGYEVFLISLSKLEIKSKIRFKILNCNELDPSVTTIVCESYLKLLSPLSFEELIVWIHHPNLSLASIEGKICANILKFIGLTPSQFRANDLRNRNLHIISPMYKALQHQTRKFPRLIKGQGMSFGYIGSLTPEKGFHHVLQYWGDILKIDPSARLHVFGSGSLYKSTKLGEVIPCDIRYEKKLLKINNCNNANITFHGLVEGLDEYLDCIDIGLLNPFASAEAYPDSILKFYEYGIPVVSGMFNGSRDLLFMNEEIQFPNMMPVKAIHWLTKNENYTRASKNVINFMNNRISNKEVIFQWEKIIRLGESEEPTLINRNRNYVKSILNLIYFRLKYTAKSYLVRL